MMVDSDHGKDSDGNNGNEGDQLQLGKKPKERGLSFDRDVFSETTKTSGSGTDEDDEPPLREKPEENCQSTVRVHSSGDNGPSGSGEDEDEESPSEEKSKAMGDLPLNSDDDGGNNEDEETQLKKGLKGKDLFASGNLIAAKRHSGELSDDSSSKSGQNDQGAGSHVAEEDSQSNAGSMSESRSDVKKLAKVLCEASCSM